MLVPRKKPSMVNRPSSSGKPNTRRREMIRTPKKLLIEERRHLLQNALSSPSDTDIEDDNNNHSRPRAKSSFYTHSGSTSKNDDVWSMQSLLDNCPSSPSPICSPVSSRASNHKSINLHVSESNTDDVVFVTPRETSCLTETETKNSISPDEIQEETTNEIKEETFSLQPYDFTFPRPEIHAQNRRGVRFSNQGISCRTVPINQQYVVHEPSEISESSNNNNNNNNNINTNNNRPRNERVYRQNWQLTTVHSQLSSVGEWDLSTNEGFYFGDDENSGGSVIELKMKEMEAKFKAWKEGRNFKLLNRLRKKEDTIEEWEKKQIAKAKQKVRHIEIKLEIKRRRALDKARKKIEKAQKKAEKRKLREQNATAKKIVRSNKAFEKISCTGKLLWILACF